MFGCDITPGHATQVRQATLVAGAGVNWCCRVPTGVEPLDCPTSDVDHLGILIGLETDGVDAHAYRLEGDAVERRFGDAPEIRVWFCPIAVHHVGPRVFAAVEVRIGALISEAVEALQSSDEIVSVDSQFVGQLTGGVSLAAEGFWNILTRQVGTQRIGLPILVAWGLVTNFRVLWKQ